MPPTVHVLTWLFSGFYVLCLLLCYFVLVFFSLFSIAITLLGEERANLSAFRTFVRFVLVWFCRFPLPLGIWEGLQFGIVTFPGLFSYPFFLQVQQALNTGHTTYRNTRILLKYRNTHEKYRNTCERLLLKELILALIKKRINSEDDLEKPRGQRSSCKQRRLIRRLI